MVARLVSPLAAFQKRTLLQKAFHRLLAPAQRIRCFGAHF
jgi:hypothetical protein